MTEETYKITINLTTLLGVNRTVTREKYEFAHAINMARDYAKLYTVRSWKVVRISDGQQLAWGKS